MKKQKLFPLIALIVLVLAALACNNAEQTVNTAPSDSPFKSITVVTNSAVPDNLKWVEANNYEIDGFLIQTDALWINSAKFSVQLKPYETLHQGDTLILELKDGGIKYFRVIEGKLMISNG